MKQMLMAHKDILVKLRQMEGKLLKHDGQLKRHKKEMKTIFTVLKELLGEEAQPMRKIGFKRKEED